MQCGRPRVLNRMSKTKVWRLTVQKRGGKVSMEDHTRNQRVGFRYGSNDHPANSSGRTLF
jgi:hypothetical protein